MSTYRLPSLEAKSGNVSGHFDAELLGIFQKDKKPVSAKKGPGSSLLARSSKGDAFTAKAGSTLFVRFAKDFTAESALLVGLGDPGDVTEEKARVAGGNAWAKLKAERAKTVLVQADSFAMAKGSGSKLSTLELVQAFAEGMLLGAYQFDKHKSGKGGDGYAGPSQLVFRTGDSGLKAKLSDALELVADTARAVNITRDWSNEPSNYGTPEYFADEAKKLAREYGLKCTILTEKDALREKMGLFIGVGQGSEREGRIVVLEYAPKKGKKKGMKTLAFVGKGVTFDSGGISIKPSLRMEDMKHDMTGAATLLGATLLAARMKVPNRIITILAFTENMPSGIAIQPGNVLVSRSGKTVEVINTDAEGRLILADVLDYAQDYKPDAIVDAATLTGAVSIALGKYCCAVLGSDEGLIALLREAGAAVGERIWQLPMYDEYFDDLRSDYADMKNSANDAYGGTIRGAIFMKQFIKKGVKWAHLDIAATAWNLSHLAYFPKKGASGAYVRTMARFARDFS